MPNAFVLLNTELGGEDAIVRDLKNLEEVKEVFQVYGVYDIIAKVESDTMDKVKKIIVWKLRNLKGVKSTLTLTVTK
jgi:DNA-binding Lrp family transcriptional regulator